MFDYPILEVLLAIEKEGSFERAALSLGVSKSYISQRLRLLEERMGGIVVCRETIATTHLGSSLCRHYENVRLLEQQFLHENQDLFKMEDPGPVTIKVAVGDDSLSSWFKTALSSLSSVQNRFFLDVVTCREDKTLSEMKRGKMHAALSYEPKPLPGFETHFLGSHAYRATATPQFVKRFFPDGVTKRSLKAAPSLQYAEDETHRSDWISQVTGEQTDTRASLVPSSHGILNTCLRGSVWAMNSSLLVDKHIEKGELIELVPGNVLHRDIYWHINRFIAEILELLTAKIQSAAKPSLSNSLAVGMLNQSE